MRRLVRLSTLVAVIALLLGATAARAARPLTTGFTDDGYGARAARLQDAAALGARVVRFDLKWSDIAGKTATPGDASDPSNPAYNWSYPDQVVRDASARGLSVVFTVFNAPAWAEGPGRPSNFIVGTWNP